MSSSFDKFVSSLPKEAFKFTSENFAGKKLNLMSQKGVYPYDYIDCFEKFNQTKLPTKEQFYSILNDLIIPPPEQFRDEYRLIPKLRTDRPPQIRENQNARRPRRKITTTTTKKEHEGPIIPPLQFWDDKPVQEPDSITDQSSLEINELNQALKGHVKSYEIEIQDDLYPLNHFTKTKLLVKSHLSDLLKIMKGYKFIETLEVMFKKKISNSKAWKA